MVMCHPVTSDCAAALLRYGVPQISAMGYCPNGRMANRRKATTGVGMRFRRSVILVICEFDKLALNMSSAAVMGAPLGKMCAMSTQDATTGPEFVPLPTQCHLGHL